MITVTVQYQFSYSQPPIRGYPRELPLQPQTVQKVVCLRGGGGALLCTSFHLSGEQVQWVASGYARMVAPLSLFYQCLFLFLCRSKLDGGQ
jgi:hypothetical protein